jgi:hypothetical protein
MSELLQLVEEPLDQVALAVARFVPAIFPLAIS